MASAGRMMEKPGQEQLQQQQQALKCPRCDSSNTKFCYYNNYSLSQPRHFCKACKRYWTRGGTLRNVPVGGGCRKNKRVKRPSSASDGVSSSSSAPSSNSNPPSQTQIDLSSPSNHINPLFYGLPTNPSEMSLHFPRFSSGNVETVSGYDLQPHLNGLGLGFSSGILSNGDSNYQNSFNPSKSIQDMVTSNSSLLSSYSLFSSPSSNTASPTIASLLASKFNNGGLKDARGHAPFQTLTPFEDLHIANNGEAGNMNTKEVKLEDSQSRLGWNNSQNQTEHIGLSDPSLYWNATTVGSNWHDPANIGSSVPSMI
ncbi:hypothetical protein UlMin_017084 [Ulmus minor]